MQKNVVTVAHPAQDKAWASDVLFLPAFNKFNSTLESCPGSFHDA